MKDIANFHKFGNKFNCFFITRTDFIFWNGMSAVCSTGFYARNINVRITGKNINTADKKAFFFCFL